MYDYVDPFTQLSHYASEVWQSSKCLQHEQQIIDDLSSLLEKNSWQRHAQNNRLWSKADRQTVVCLVDDIRAASLTPSAKTQQLFDANSLIVTDNLVGVESAYTLLPLPKEFFHIYHYHPADNRWDPQRDFSYTVNRIDHRRMFLLLIIAEKLGLDRGLVNFNCISLDNHRATGRDHEVLRRNWARFYGGTDSGFRQRFDILAQPLADLMPFKNYDFGHEKSQVSSWLNIVVETYASDETVALSEKIFRALIQPVPWVAYLGRHGVTWLEQLGFDCASDIINHASYDSEMEAKKCDKFIDVAKNVIQDLKNLGPYAVHKRMEKAAAHNVSLLDKFKQRWPMVYDSWQQQFLSEIK